MNRPRHRGRFKWRKYSKHSGNLKDYWTNGRRTADRHRAEPHMNLTERIERVIEDHQWLFEIDQCSCGCEWFVEGGTDDSTCYDNHLARKVIEALDLGTPCAATGCRIRQIACRHAEASGGLTDSKGVE